jgi:hypothetical protein
MKDEEVQYNIDIRKGTINPSQRNEQVKLYSPY